MRKILIACLLNLLFAPLFASTVSRPFVCVDVKDGIVQILPIADNAVRIRINKSGVWTMPELVYVDGGKEVKYKVVNSAKSTTLRLPAMSLVVDKMSGRITYYNSLGKQVLGETGRSVVPSAIQGEQTFISRQSFHSPEDECLFGLGQFQDGYLNIRGLQRRLTQVNTQISVPMILSNKGYALLWNNYGLTEFNPSCHKVELARQNDEGEQTTVDVTSTEGNRKEVRMSSMFSKTIDIDKTGNYSLLLDVGQSMAHVHNLKIDGVDVISMKNLWLPPTASAIVHISAGRHTFSADLGNNDNPVMYYKPVDDETIFSSPVSQGVDYTVFVGSADEAIAAYRQVTGNAPMMPLWALGYVHCRERFHSSDEILTTANRFRKERLPLDMIVQDWQYWGKYGWNAMKFDEDHYPNPKLLVDSLHRLNTKFMLSVWSKADRNTEVGKQMAAANYYIPGTDWIDFFNPDAASCYWKNFSSRLLRPYGIDAWWQDATEPENDDLNGRKINQGTVPGEVYRNVFPMFVNKTVYEGCRQDNPQQRSMILTRCGFSGIQRYGVALWSGDVGYDYETLRRQITAGLGLMSAGLPWWTYDAGGFFRPGSGQYADKGYHQLFARWLETAAFLPMMRVHGYQTDTEFWNYGEDVMSIARKYLKVRYSLMPYIYTEAANVSFRGSSIMRPLVMDYAVDSVALSQKYEYMFGPSLLIAPVVEPDVNSWQVYLPKQRGGWYDFWNNDRYEQCGDISVLVTIDKIPVFVKAGTILPVIEEDIQSTAEMADKPITLKVYPGNDAKYELYLDDGVSYEYEGGNYSRILISWKDDAKRLTIDKCTGNFLKGKTITFIVNGKRIDYNGKKVSMIYNS